MLIFMNIYPVARFRDMLFESKYVTLQNQASVVASSLSTLSRLTDNEVEKVMELLNDMQSNRIVVTDTDARIVYDSASAAIDGERYALFSEVARALSGMNVFHSEYKDGALISRTAIPVTYRAKTIGAVYIYEYETEQAAFIVALQNTLEKISIFIILISLLLALLLSHVLTGRIGSILKAIKLVRSGEYGYNVEVRGKDELAQLGNEFNSLVDRLQKTEDTRQRFVSDASHELKTPLAAIRLLSDSILQNENMDGETIREFVSDIGREAERLSRITEKLLDITRLKSPQDERFAPLDMGEVVEQAMKMLRAIAGDKGIQIECKIGEGCNILAVKDDIHQIVFNLVENAIKYNVKNGSVTVLLFVKDDTVRFIVDDTGIGIPPEDLPHVFDRFYRVDKARNSEVGGSGLGLSIVRDMVIKHGGTVTASNRAHGGTRFEVVFPLYKKEVRA